MPRPRDQQDGVFLAGDQAQAAFSPQGTQRREARREADAHRLVVLFAGDLGDPLKLQLGHGLG